MRDREKRETRQIALERMGVLFTQAREVLRENPTLADRYVKVARRVGMRARVRLPREWRFVLCRGCKGLLAPGFNCRVRVRQRREPHLVVSCMRCGRQKRIPLKAKPNPSTQRREELF